MKITKEEVIHVANLAHLQMDENSIDKFAEQMGTILEYFDTLNQVDTKGVKPTFHTISLTNAFRGDEEHQHLDNEKALANAPEKDEGCFLVPKVIG